ncbi:MAG: HAMP domain-containing histidine kinase [Elusimicrobia bacterium]|nr:HAMP domain-containing histidine kinase [Elusimicrobiota bacterium]
MRISLKLAVVFALFGAAIAGGFQYSRVKSARNEMYAGQSRMAEVAVSAVKAMLEASRAQAGDYGEVSRGLRELQGSGIASVLVKDARGRWVVWRAGTAAAQRQTHPGLPLDQVTDGFYDVEAPVKLGRRGQGLVQVSFSISPLEAKLRALEADAFGSGLMAFLATTLAAWLIGTWFGTKLEQLVPKLEALSRDPERFRSLKIPSTGDEVVRLVAAFNRMGEHLKAETHARRLAEREKAELSAMLVHDLKTPLTVIHSGISLLQDQLSQDQVAVERRSRPVAPVKPGMPLRRKFDQPNRRTFELLKMSADRLHRMVEDVLQLSRLEEVAELREVAFVDMVELARTCAKDFQLVVAERGQSLRLDVPEDGVPVRVQGDGPLLRRVLDNLVHNAVEHTPPGGVIRVRLEATSAVARVEVCDSGPGIPAEARADIFRKFFQKDLKRHVGNVGLGLALCQKAVQRHGGKIGVEDAKPKGAAFYFTLPRVSGEGQPQLA